MKGIIYKYTSPIGKHYIGQTINEKQRKLGFKSSKSYAGIKIDLARAEFGVDNFKYEVLEIVEHTDNTYFKILLNQREWHYIEMYDAIENGYNSMTEFNGINKLSLDDYKIFTETEEFKELHRGISFGRFSPLRLRTEEERNIYILRVVLEIKLARDRVKLKKEKELLPKPKPIYKPKPKVIVNKDDAFKLIYSKLSNGFISSKDLKVILTDAYKKSNISLTAKAKDILECNFIEVRNNKEMVKKIDGKSVKGFEIIKK